MGSISQLTLDEETRNSINCLHYKNRCFLDGDISFKDQKIENDDIVIFTDQTDKALLIGVIEAFLMPRWKRREVGFCDVVSSGSL